MSQLTSPILPRSVVSWADPFIITTVITSAYVMLRATSLTDVELTLALVGVVMAFMIPIEWLRSPMRRQPRPVVTFSETLKNSLIKTLGILAGVLLLVLAWTLIPEYARKEYITLFEAMPYVLPELPLVIFIWVLWSERRLGSSRDYAWHFGLAALGRYKQVDWNIVRDGLFGWLVKGFFLPLNFTAATAVIYMFRGKEAAILTDDWPKIVSTLDHMIFGLLVVAIIPGYFFSARILHTDIKKTDQSWFGWMVTFFCYPPVNRGTSQGWFLYAEHSQTALPWVVWCGASGMVSYGVGIILIFTYLVHYWGESIGCLRSSHLSNRGIITNGPFRVTKHPVYVIKCVGWTLAYLPFLSAGSLRGDVSHGLSYFAFCCVYIARGWVEERLLSTDSDYVAYAMWMEKHSIFSFMGRWFPILSFEWRLKRWQKNHANLIETI